jgi:hypothetical protein
MRFVSGSVNVHVEEMQQKRMIYSNCLPEILSRLLYIYLHQWSSSSSWPDWSSGQQWQSLITAISWWRWWFDTFGSDSHKVMTEFIATLGNKIVITVLNRSDSDNEGGKQSFISEVGTLGSICILKDLIKTHARLWIHVKLILSQMATI